MAWELKKSVFMAGVWLLLLSGKGHWIDGTYNLIQNNFDWDLFKEFLPHRDTIVFRYQVKLLEKREDKFMRKEKWTHNENEILKEAVQYIFS